MLDVNEAELSGVDHLGSGTRCVLIVEDNPLTREFLRGALEAEGVSVVEATDGRSALRLVRLEPHLVLQDLTLPDLDGLELARRLRIVAGCELPIICLSDFPSQLEQAKASDLFVNHLKKPVARALLVEVVQTHLWPTCAIAIVSPPGRRAEQGVP